MYVVNSSVTSDESKPKSDQIENKLETACQKSIVSTHNKLVLHNKIGEGLYSHVFVGSFKTKEKNIADRFAVKISDKCKDKNLFLQEVQALFKMKDCQFIIDIITYYTHKNIPYLLLELGDIDLGNLFEIMIKKNIQLSYGNINFTENTNWEDTRLYSIIKKMRSETPEEHINPKGIYNKLTLLEPLPMMLE